MRSQRRFDEFTHLSISTCRVSCLNLRSEVKEFITMVTHPSELNPKAKDGSQRRDEGCSP